MSSVQIVLVLLTLLQAVPALAQHGHHAAHTASAGVPELKSQLGTVREATARYRDLRAAQADGYVRFGRAEGPLMGEHWFRRDLVDLPLDPARPSTLQYAVIDGRRELVGVAYTLYLAPGDPMPAGFADDQDRWHQHDVRQVVSLATERRPLLRLLAERRSDRGERTLLTMLHAWVWLENPDGVFADQHRILPYLRAGLPAHFATDADVDAAWGVALLDPKTCGWELNRISLLARPSRGQRQALQRGCQEAAQRVEQMRGAEAAELNRAAVLAWREYEALRTRTLTHGQRARLDALVEHPH